MADAPLLARAVLEALVAHPEGVSVKTLAEEMGESESSVRSALNWNLRKQAVNRRMGPAVGPTKPPFLFTLVSVDLEKEIPHMPTVNQPPSDEDEDITPATQVDEESPESQEGDPEESGDQDGQVEQPTSPVSPPAHRAPRKPAQAAIDTMDRREVVAAEQHQAAKTGHLVGGTKRIERVDPIPAGFPVEEKGMLGKPVEESTLPGRIEEYIEQQYGGGSFIIHPCGADAQTYGGRIVQVDIAGTPKPVTAAGRVWLEKYNKRIEEASEAKNGGKVPDFMTFMDMMDRRTTAARQEMAASFNQTLQLIAPKPSDTSGAREREEAHREELDRVRADADKRVGDLKDSMTLQVKNLETQISALREDMRTERTALVNASVKEKAELQAAHLQRVADLVAAHGKELQAVKDQGAKDLVAAKEQASQNLEAFKKNNELQTRISHLEKAPPDVNTEIQRKMIPEIVRLATAQAKRAAGIVDEDEGPETLMDALKGAVAEAGPEMMKRVASGIMSILEQKAGAPAAGAAPPRPGIPQRPAQPPRRPGPFPVRTAAPVPAPRSPTQPPASPVGVSSLLRERSAPVAPPPPPPVELTEEQQAALVSHAAAPSPAPTSAYGQGVVVEPPLDAGEPAAEEQELTPVQQATALRLRTFFEVLFTEMQIDSAAAEVWTVPIPGTDFSFEDLYFKLPGTVRTAMENAEPEKAWPAVLAALHVTPADDPLLEAIQGYLDGNTGAPAWLTAFFEAGPWNQVEDDETEEEDLVPDQRPPAVPEVESHPDQE